MALPNPGGETIRQESKEFGLNSRGRGLHDFTGEIVAWVRASGIREGLLTLHVRHTSASLLIQENADPEVQRDLEAVLLAVGAARATRSSVTRSEGPDDMPAHVRSALTATSLSIPVAKGRPALGTWQGIYLYEHRDAPHRRRVAAHLIGE